jgi:hypothetical protein
VAVADDDLPQHRIAVLIAPGLGKAQEELLIAAEALKRRRLDPAE